MRRSIFFALLPTLAVVFSGCSSDSGGGVGDYIASDASFTLVYPDGDVSVKSEKRGQSVVGVIDGTEMSFSYDLDSGACSVGCGDVEIPLSAEAGAGLGSVLSAVFPTQYESGYAGERLFLDSGGRVLLEGGVPVSVEVGGRVIEIRGFLIKAGETDETQERGVH